jgi:hypothetical protein
MKLWSSIMALSNLSNTANLSNTDNLSNAEEFCDGNENTTQMATAIANSASVTQIRCNLTASQPFFWEVSFRLVWKDDVPYD